MMKKPTKYANVKIIIKVKKIMEPVYVQLKDILWIINIALSVV